MAGGIGMGSVLASRKTPAARLSYIWPYISVANKDRVLKFKLCMEKHEMNVGKNMKFQH